MKRSTFLKYIFLTPFIVLFGVKIAKEQEVIQLPYFGPDDPVDKAEFIALHNLIFTHMPPDSFSENGRFYKRVGDTWYNDKGRAVNVLF